DFPVTGVQTCALPIFVVAIIGVGPKGAVLAIGVAFTPHFARFTYSLVASVMVRDYMSAARVVGVSRSGISKRYVGRNVADSLVIRSEEHTSELQSRENL